MKQLKQGDNMFILKGILLVSARLFCKTIPSSRFSIGRRFDIYCKSVPSSRLRR